MTGADRLTVATWNLAGGRDRDGASFDVVSRCAALDVDVLALQETLTPEHVDLAAAVADRLGYAHVVTAGEPGRRAHVALLSRIPLEPRHPVVLAPAPGWCGGRAVARAQLDPGGWDLSVAVVHACHRPDTAARQLRHLARRLADDPAPAVLLGDCNLWGAVVRRLLPDWSAASREPTWPADRPRHALDQVLVRGLRVSGGAVVDVGGSDHRAVRATLVRAVPPVPTGLVDRPTTEGS